jgi:hypothetical protein
MNWAVCESDFIISGNARNYHAVLGGIVITHSQQPYDIVHRDLRQSVGRGLIREEPPGHMEHTYLIEQVEWCRITLLYGKHWKATNQSSLRYHEDNHIPVARATSDF